MLSPGSLFYQEDAGAAIETFIHSCKSSPDCGMVMYNGAEVLQTRQ
jgi:hypothetical protein